MKTKKQFIYPSIEGSDLPSLVGFLTGLGQQLVRYLRDIFDDLTDLQSAVDSLPTATVDLRGKFALLRGGAGVADILYVCAKKADDLYYWRVVTIT